MIIVSQDRKAITESLELRIDCNVIEEGEFPNIKTNIDSYCIVDIKHSLYLGTYKTEKRVKEVLAEITEFWKNGAMTDCKGFICYEMPED